MRLFVAAAVASALVLTGCVASAKPHHVATAPSSQADRMKAVVHAWSANLNAGNNAAEARLFKLPALISLMTGPYGCNRCLTPAEVVQFHAQLPCSAEIESIRLRGRYATAAFRLGDREISTCDTPGALLAVRFTIVRGKITAFEQVFWRPPGRAAIRTPQSQADRMIAVVRAWIANETAGNNAAAARLFKLPAPISLMPGASGYGCWCMTRAEVARFHARLPCSGKIVSIKVRGRDATAVFSLRDRKTSECDSPPGSLTAVRFTIVRGKIIVWQQVWWKPPGATTTQMPGR